MDPLRPIRCFLDEALFRLLETLAHTRRITTTKENIPPQQTNSRSAWDRTNVNCFHGFEGSRLREFRPEQLRGA